MIEIFILSIIQGITEFLPVSSSSHLILISNYIKFENQGLSIDVSLHIGSFLAVILYFYEDILNFIKNKILFLKILISSFPVMLVGYILVKLNYIDQLRDIKIIAWTTIIFGILLYISDKSKIVKKLENDLSYKSIFFIGIFQIISLVPGVSRSGIIITASRFLNFDRIDSTKIAFYLSIPALAGASVLGISDLVNEEIKFDIVFLLSIFLSFIISYITIKYFLIFVSKFSLNLFVYYRIFLSIILFALIYF